MALKLFMGRHPSKTWLAQRAAAAARALGERVVVIRPEREQERIRSARWQRKAKRGAERLTRQPSASWFREK